MTTVKRAIALLAVMTFAPFGLHAQRAATERPVQRNLITHNLFGKWVVDTGLTLRLGGGALAGSSAGSDDRAGFTIEFTEDSAVVHAIPPAMAVHLKAFVTRKSGHVAFGGTRYPFVMITDTIGNSNILYFRERRGDPFGDGESFLISIIPGKEQADDLLFMGGDFSHEPFSAFRRPGSRSTKN